MDKVFIVTEGAYSDYRIVAVFSTLEAAENFIAADTSEYPDYNGVEEYIMDSLTIRPGFRSYCILMDEDGCYELRSSVMSSKGYGDYLMVPWGQSNWKLSITRYVVSEEHAVKIANEIRARRVATLGWPKEIPTKDGIRYKGVSEL